MEKAKVWFDLEFYNDRLLCGSYSVDGECPKGFGPRIPSSLALLLADPYVTTVCHSKADWRWIKMNTDIKIAGPLEDTMVKAWVLNENQPLDLEYLAKRYCDIVLDKRIKSVDHEPMFRCDDGKYVHLTDAPPDQLLRYNWQDTSATVALDEKLTKELVAKGWWGYYEEEQRPFTEVLLAMETNGLPFDEAASSRLREKLTDDLAKQTLQLDNILRYPLRTKDGKPGYGSPALLRNVLFTRVWQEDAVVPHRRNITKAHLVSEIAAAESKPKSAVTDAEVEDARLEIIEKVRPRKMNVDKVTPKNLVGHYVRPGLGLPETPPTDPSNPDSLPTTAMPVLLTTFPDVEFVQHLREWAKTRKVITTYLDAFPRFTKDGRVYGTFNQTGTKTGRLSSARPNLQNIPAHGHLGDGVRKLFRGRLVVGDYSQLEPRLMAHYSQDPKLLEVYHEGLDIYAVTAAGIFGGKPSDYGEKHPKRKMSKPLYLGDQYGAGPDKLWLLLKLNGFDVSLDEVRRFQDRLHSHFHVLTAWKEQTAREAKRRGFVETIDGHRRRLDFKGRSWKDRGRAERQAVNAKIQGSAGDVVRRAMLEAYREFPNLAMLAQVHDEVVWEARGHVLEREDLMDLEFVMSERHGFKLDVPLVFEPSICNTWADKGLSDIEWVEE